MNLISRPAAPGDRVTWRQEPVDFRAPTTLYLGAGTAPSVERDIDAERARGIAIALELLRQGRPGLARYSLTRSVMRQHRIATGQTIEIHPTCACGGRCPKGGS